MHQTVVKFIGWSIESDKIMLLKIKFNQENCQQKDTPLILKQMSRRMIDSPRCCFIPFIGWKFDASMHTAVRCIGEINRWIKQRSQCVRRSNASHSHVSERILAIKALGAVRKKPVCIIHENFYFLCRQQWKVAVHIVHKCVLYARFYVFLTWCCFILTIA